MGHFLSTEQTELSPKGRIANENVSDIREEYIKSFHNAPLWSFTDQATSSTAQLDDDSKTGEQAQTDPEPVEKHFFKSYLENLGVLDLDSTPASGYIDDEDVHPLFALSNFDTTLLGAQQTRRAWEAFRPALVLATKMITAPDARRGFWHRLIHGNLTVDPATRKRVLTPSKREGFPTSSTAFDSLLNDLAGRLTFYVLPPAFRSVGQAKSTPLQMLANVPQVFEHIKSQMDAINDPESRAYFDTFCPGIGINSTFFEHALNPASPIHAGSDPWNAANFSLQLYLAQALTHELIHVLWYWRLRMFEPFTFPGDKIPETGFAWNVWSVGCVITPYEFRAKDIAKTALSVLEGTSWQFLYVTPKISTILESRWVLRWFLKKTWAAGIWGEKWRETSLWGSAPCTAKPGCPKYFVAHRLLLDRNHGKGPRIRPILYVDGHPKLVVEDAVQHTEAELDHLFAGPGRHNTETWYLTVRSAIKGSVVKLGLASTNADLGLWTEVDHWGAYEYKRATAYGKEEEGTSAPKTTPTESSGGTTKEVPKPSYAQVVKKQTPVPGKTPTPSRVKPEAESSSGDASKSSQGAND